MQKIEGVQLEEVIKDAANELFEEDRLKVNRAIKQVLYRVNGLKLELKEVEKKKSQIEEKLQKAEQKMEKIGQGDWSVLTEDNNGLENKSVE